MCSSIFAEQSCNDIISSNKKVFKHPPLSKTHKVVYQGRGFVVYIHKSKENVKGSLRVLFNSRVAFTNSATSKSNGTKFTHAIFVKNTDQVYIQEGRHRAIAASKGKIIPQHLGGTDLLPKS